MLLTGATPRTGSGSRVCRLLASGEPPPPPHTLVEAVPAALEGPCLAALAPEPRDRPAAGELADALQGWLEGRSLRPTREDAEFLRTYSSLEFRRPSLTVDLVVATAPAGAPARVFLLRRPQPPYAGAWGCPGSFVQLEETLEDAAARVLREKVGLTHPPEPEQLGAYGALHRDPRARVVTVAFLVVLPGEAGLAPEPGRSMWHVPGDDPHALEWAFDHRRLVLDGLRRIQAR